MPDDVARALGAAEANSITIADKECLIGPLLARQLAEIERECLHQYKDEYLTTVSENLHRVPNKRSRENFMVEEIQKVAKWDVSDLPPKRSYDASGILMSDRLKQWLENQYQMSSEEEAGEAGPSQTSEALYIQRLKRVCAVALDDGSMTPDDYREMTKQDAPFGLISYVNWWITGCFEGRITVAWKSFEKFGVTKLDIENEFRADQSFNSEHDLAKLALDIERATVPAVGNG